MEQQRKTIQIKTRITEAQHEQLVQKAERAGMTISELIRHSVMNKPVVSRADVETANSIDRIGRMFKHYYPKDQARQAMRTGATGVGWLKICARWRGIFNWVGEGEKFAGDNGSTSTAWQFAILCTITYYLTGFWFEV